MRVAWVLITHLQHLPPMRRRGVAMSSVSGREVAGLGCMVDILGAAERVSQLSCVDDVSHAAFSSLLVLSRCLRDQHLWLVVHTGNCG